MRMSLTRLLEHPSLAAARPRVLAGADRLDRAVRWIHSSEVLDIAPLLRGGELLLTGGTTLAAAPPEKQRSYVRALAARAVAGLAVETGTALPAVPGPLVDEAEAAGLPVLELRRVVPFVDVAETINAALVNDSVTRLRLAADLSHRLTALLAESADVPQLLAELVRTTSAGAAVFDGSGVLVAAAPAETASGPPGGAGETGPRACAEVSSRITVRGVHMATLTQYPGADADTGLLELAQERAAEALQLALLRTRSPSPRDVAAGELVRLAASAPDPAPGTASAHRARARRLARAVGIDPEAPVLGVAARAENGTAGLAGLDAELRHHGRTALDAPSPSAVHALVSLPDRRRAGRARAALLDRLRAGTAAGRVTVAVGPAMPDLAGAATSLGAARDCLERLRHAADAPAGHVVDAAELSAERLLSRDDGRAAAGTLVSEQLGLLLALPAEEREPLLDTLAAYFAGGCNKTRTAAALHLQRQSLYGRLQRAFDVLGGDPTATPRALPLHLALRLHRAETGGGEGRG